MISPLNIKIVIITKCIHNDVCSRATVVNITYDMKRINSQALNQITHSDNEIVGTLRSDNCGADALFGYFPSYALGSAYGAHMLHVMRQTVDVDAALASGDLSPINGWLCEHIWQYGGLYEPETLLSRALGEPFDPMYYVNYLKNKYSEIYGLA